MSQVLTQYLGIKKGDVIAVVGSGGKTSLIEKLANERKEINGSKILISPTTRIMMPESGTVILSDWQDYMPAAGISYFGTINGEDGKLHAIPQDVLRVVVQGFDLSLLEADGSRNLPWKGWDYTDPVIPAGTTMTLGVISAKGIGLSATEENVFRLREFLETTGLREGDKITINAAVKSVLARNGMFWNKKGRKAIFINQAEGEYEEVAKDLRHAIRKVGFFGKIAYGSINDDWYKSLCKIKREMNPGSL
ncbi:MAG: putative selenium-dependent hydroxylase accessory protein YqeC [Lachnospiraceae bacterium]|jgi:probable selenium-dependent hydroxylase accessory protein YqeC|nr:putative selenium-dependent hydroxylase accessory protein YqeC [Lachnospiraceae bacterium]